MPPINSRGNFSYHIQFAVEAFCRDIGNIGQLLRTELIRAVNYCRFRIVVYQGQILILGINFRQYQQTLLLGQNGNKICQFDIFDTDKTFERFCLSEAPVSGCSMKAMTFSS